MKTKIKLVLILYLILLLIIYNFYDYSGYNKSLNKTEIPVISVQNKSKTQQYFEELKSITGSCRKLVRIGGTLNCKGKGDITLGRGMDGHKMICFDPELQIVTKNVKDCVVLSFGVRYETTFDDYINQMNCEVHMFDIFNYQQDWMKQKQNLYFHLMGLAAKRFRLLGLKSGLKFEYYSFSNILDNLKLKSKLIYILKIDIEGNEWDVFSDINNQTYLDAVGQIALEVHAKELLKNLTKEEKINKMQYWSNVIKGLERRGFRRVYYLDNHQKYFTLIDEFGKIFDTSGEMLLVNYNWYNQTFRNYMRNKGFNFKY